MWHPWQRLGDDNPEWHVEFCLLPDGVLGGCSIPDRVVWVDKRLGQADRRWVATHELVHIERGHVGPCQAKVECSVSAEAARRLIPIEALAEAARWSENLVDLASALWVPTRAMVIRIDHLHPAERAYLRRRVAERDG